MKRTAKKSTAASRVARKKRGIILLVVLSLLTLFILLGVTYTLIAMSYRDSSVTQARLEQYGDSPETEFDMVLGQVLYGTRDRTSLLGHSLLADLYGGDSVIGSVAPTPPPTSSVPSQFAAFNFTGLTYTSGASVGPGAMTVSDYYTGRVLTFITGSATGFSTRITRYDPSISLIEFDATEGAFTPGVGDKFLINGAPFNGTGFGYDPATRQVSQTLTDSMGTPRLTSLMPHFAGYATAIDTRQGGEDEPYDTVGPNDMQLAMVPPNPAGNRNIIPSYHRPDLMNYWQGVVAGQPPTLQAEILRQVSFRPLSTLPDGTPADHPNFTGSNPNYNPINGPWDVDNDNDGRPDSIWIDPGLPVLTSANGRRYKRLVALCIKDMDGRIQVNAHGNQQQTASLGFRPEQALSGSFGLATPGSRLPRGTGFGAAEVDFYSLFGSDANAYNNLLNGRYGADGVPGISGNDGLSIVRHHGLLNAFSAPHGWYGTVPDTFGRWIVAIDQSGQPIWSRTILGNTQGEGSDDPYELEFDPQTAVNDTPYTPAELERILRYHDQDWALLPDRLEKAGANYLNGDSHGSPGTQQQIRELIGTSGSHLPIAETIYPSHQRTQLTTANAPIGSNTILDLYRTRYASAGITGAALATEFAKVVPWEFRHGQRLDINRWLGDGLDNNGNNVPDEPGTASSPGEPAIPEPAWTDGPAHFGTLPTGYNGQQAYSGNDADANGNGTAGEAADQLFARQLMARQLYCLALLLTNDAFLGNPPAPHEPTLGAAEKVSLYRRRLAQWAVNVVDFRDADAIMTRFDYDENPWDGWSPDGTFVVWGCEHPDLLLGETLAFHDRRVKDTDKDSTMKKVDQMNGDDDPDQFRVPQGSLFAELQNVRNRFANNNKLPAELYNVSTGALDLGRVPGPGADGLNHPVWQIAISKITRNNGTLNNARPSQLSSANPESTSYEPSNMKLVGTALPLPIDRYVWFTPAGGSAVDPAGGQRIFFSATSPQIFPGQYAVVGPRQNTILGSLDPTVGMGTGLWGGDASQKITLDVGAGTVTVTDAAGNVTTRTPGTDIGPVVPIIAQLPNPDPLFPNAPGLNVTEPMPVDGNYYPAPPDHMGTPKDAYDDPETPTGTFIDKPVDYNDGMPLKDRDMIKTGTYEDVVSVFLQRLADPTRGWHPTENPYITVDWASVDVTVFTGEENTARTPATPSVPEIEPQDPKARTQAMRFRTRERGWQQTANVPEGNVWPPHTSTPATTTADPSATAGTYFNHSLDANVPTAPKHTLGYVNSRVAQPVTTPNLGDPNYPFPWLCWNDRPFSNPMELMLVPSASPERLLAEITPGPLFAGANAYKQADGATEANSRSQFVHLLNFFQASDVVNGTVGADLYRLFDFVETPSPFTHVDRYYNPGVFASSSSFKPPFNRLSKFRDPGRININTISDERVLKAAIAGMGLDSTTESNLINAMLLSRTGSTGNWWDFTSNSSVPVRMANPFRPADAADLMPVGSGVDLRQKFPVQATLLRSYDPDPTTATLTNPLLGPASAGSGQPSAGRYTAVTDPRLGESPDRNAYFKFQNFQKLGNTFTTHSNVYAVWMTMGYFEVEDNPLAPMATTNVDAGHLDGYRLGQEIGADSGEIVRHRAFFIIDRSIPVGYQTGMRHNTDKAVVLRRYIE